MELFGKKDEQEPPKREPPEETKPEGPAVAVAFRPDGKMLASADVEGAITFWNADTGQRGLTIPGRGLVFCLDGLEVVPVLKNGQLQGLVTPESVVRFLALRRGLRPQTRVA